MVEQISPTLVLTAANADPTFLSSLSEILSTLPPPPSSSSHSSGPADPSTTVQIEYRPPREFYPAAGRNALAGLGIDEGRGYDDHEVEEGEGEERWQERDEFNHEEGDLSDQEDAYAFINTGNKRNRRKKGKFSPRRRARSLNEGQGQGDRARRNAQLRLESFLNGLESSSLTVRFRLSSSSSLSSISSFCNLLSSYSPFVVRRSLWCIARMCCVSPSSLGTNQKCRGGIGVRVEWE